MNKALKISGKDRVLLLYVSHDKPKLRTYVSPYSGKSEISVVSSREGVATHKALSAARVRAMLKGGLVFLGAEQLSPGGVVYWPISVTKEAKEAMGWASGNLTPEGKLKK